MLRGFILIWLLVLGPTAARAGAWMRDQGSGFAAASATLRHSFGAWSSELGFYGDFGLSAGLTLGIDLNDTDNLSGHALVFARIPLELLPSGHHLATELALGGAHSQNRWRPMQRLTLSYGRGFDSAWGPGWLAVDGAYEMRGTSPDPILKLDATIGLTEQRRLRPMLQIETAKISGQRLFYSITPSLQIPLPQQVQLLIGLEHRVAPQRSLGLKVGVWHRF
ncbi:hypothetical protein [Parasedimentitalea psychrophila]|uniref:Uncharacterized protein n=1 Tax=Parasedimentitalea psychrophila TaxID=2997337 RepID=A0A9Y2L2D8_9RHOB|nr:hypothetical protein [Parasedimentitalea psychrophila]WIY27500.1 hypothetical protein QPJ95_11640 [Parasedimentitalea psychrophila]